MPAIGQFGPVWKGPPFNTHLGSLLVPAGGFDVTFSASNAGTTSMWVSGLDVESPQACIVVLRIGGTIRWRGRVGWSVPLVCPRWHDAEFEIPPGTTYTVEICHFESTAVEVSANIMGFTR